jgi:hypothetical protein
MNAAQTRKVFEANEMRIKASQRLGAAHDLAVAPGASTVAKAHARDAYAEYLHACIHYARTREANA